MLSDFPDISAEWADDLNAIDKRTARAGSARVAHWRCAQGHVWPAPVNQRTIRQTRCGDCHTARANATNSVAAVARAARRVGPRGQPTTDAGANQDHP